MAQDFREIKWDLISGKVKFAPQLMKSHYDWAPIASTFSNTNMVGYRSVKICVRCSNIEPLDECSNCGSEEFEPGMTGSGTLGVFCYKCKKGMTRWTCPKCNTDNAISQTLATEPSQGCLIATSARGGAYAPEVVELRTMRESLIKKTRWGKDFIERFNQHYYSFSPQIATAMDEDPEMRETIGWSLVTPLLNYFRLVAERPSVDVQELDILPESIRTYIKSLWKDMDSWLAMVNIPQEFDNVATDVAVTEIGIYLRLFMKGSKARLAWLDGLRQDGRLPLAAGGGDIPRLRAILIGLGVTHEECLMVLDE